MTWLKPLFVPFYLALCITLGGASAGGYIANFVLQILAIGLLCWALATPKASPYCSAERYLAWLIITLCGLVLLQFLPLPYGIWTMLGERAEIAAFAKQSGITVAYPAVSLMPHESLKSAVWMLPALGVLVWMVRTRAYKPVQTAWALVAMTGISLVLGALQIGGGQDSKYYLYEITNRGSTVGFFANSNHLATLLLVSIPFVPAVVSVLSERYRLHRYPLLIGAVGLVLVVLAGIYANGSLTGYSLVLPVLAASLLLGSGFKRVGRLAPYLIGVLVLAGISLPFLTDEGGAMIAANVSLEPGDRRVIFANTIHAAVDYAPSGSGVGSFLEVYRQYQDPLTISSKYINHAHNDYLEVVMETGLIGALVMLAFLVWWFWRVLKIWKVRDGCVFGKAATIASGAVLLHSLVDYPLRTAAISCIFAISIALMARRTDREVPPSLPLT